MHDFNQLPWKRKGVKDYAFAVMADVENARQTSVFDKKNVTNVRMSPISTTLLFDNLNSIEI